MSQQIKSSKNHHFKTLYCTAIQSDCQEVFKHLHKSFNPSH